MSTLPSTNQCGYCMEALIEDAVASQCAEFADGFGGIAKVTPANQNRPAQGLRLRRRGRCRSTKSRKVSGTSLESRSQRRRSSLVDGDVARPASRRIEGDDAHGPA